MTSKWPDYVDHVDLHKHNNRWENLREANAAQNGQNTPRRKNKTSQYKGVYWNKELHKWSAQICINKVNTHIGHYHYEIEAHEAYVAKAKKHFGEFARAA